MIALIIRGGHVLTGDWRSLEQADVRIERDRIVAIAPRLELSDDAEAIDAGGCLLIPGLVNAHTHAHNNLLRNLANCWTLEDLLNRGMSLYSNRSRKISTCLRL